ncbi:MAG: acetate--CoA ligase family protein [Candidatus Kapaibacteriota bacterium]
MFNQELVNPKSIALIGASNDPTKPGGKALLNLLSTNYSGKLYPVNPKEESVQGMKCYQDVTQLPDVDLAILAIASKFVNQTVEFLAKNRKTKAFIVFSAGFSEIGEEGKQLENELAEIIKKYDASLIGPNCIGVLNTNYAGVFAGPIPKLDKFGCDFVSGSGATAVFILETAIQRGLPFSSIYSVGNSATIGVEEVLEYWDETFNPENSSKNKLIYIEQVHNPEKFLKHTTSLILKGCRIAAVKSGTTEAGSRAVSSHTGSLAGSDAAVEALFKKAGIIRCYSREELITVASILNYKELKGKNIAVITHAGGPGILCTDALQKNGLNVPKITSPKAEELLSKLYYGSSVANPIDFLATGTAEQLGIILDYVDNYFDEIDGMIVIFGTPGLFNVTEVYNVLHQKLSTCKKPIFPVLPSPIQAKEETEHFVNLGRTFFPDETPLATALAKVYYTPKPHLVEQLNYTDYDEQMFKEILAESENDNFINPNLVSKILDAVHIKQLPQIVSNSFEELTSKCKNWDYPLVMKVVGPVHKSDVGGVILNIQNIQELEKAYQKIMSLKDATAVLVQPMIKGTELFVGIKKEKDFGHLIFFGLGGIFIEVLKDVNFSLAPLDKVQAQSLIKNIKAYPIIKGIRGQKGIDEEQLAEIIIRISDLIHYLPEIEEMDINPLIATKKEIFAIDTRIKIKK